MPRRAANTRRGLVSWPLYRLLLVIALVPVLVAALATREPALPPTPPTPPKPFNGSAAATRAAYMLSLPKMRGPGGKGDLAAAGWISSQLERFGYRVSEQTFAADLPDQPNVPMKNVIGYLPGRLPDLIAVVAHHDGVGTGADDNASSVGVMLELARELRSTSPEHGLLFLSTDGGTTGGQGAAYFAEHSRFAGRVVSAIVLDSVAALVTRQELEGEIGDSTVGAQARLMSAAMRKLTSLISKARTCCIFTNQIREKIGVMFGNPETTPGGKALKFYASVRIDIRRIGAIKQTDGVVTGNRTRVKVVKNKVAPPFTEAEFDIMYNEGISSTGALLDLALEKQIIEKRGSWLSYKGTQLAQGRDAGKDALKNDPALYEEIETAVKAKLDEDKK